MTITSSVDNGVKTDALLAARDALREAPAAAEFVWRATSVWNGGTRSTQTIDGFIGLGAEQKHKRPYVLEGDHPEVFASEDNAPTPVETVLAALAGCLTAGIAAVAQNRQIQLHSVTATVEGTENILGILGGDPGRAQRFQRDFGPLRHRRRRIRGGHRRTRGAVSETFRRVRRPDQPDQRHRQRQLRGSPSG